MHPSAVPGMYVKSTSGPTKFNQQARLAALEIRQTELERALDVSATVHARRTDYADALGETFEGVYPNITNPGFAAITHSVHVGNDQDHWLDEAACVQLEKAFTKVDGADVYRKTIVVATCTPA